MPGLVYCFDNVLLVKIDNSKKCKKPVIIKKNLHDIPSRLLLWSKMALNTRSLLDVIYQILGYLYNHFARIMPSFLSMHLMAWNVILKDYSTILALLNNLYYSPISLSDPSIQTFVLKRSDYLLSTLYTDCSTH